MVFLIILCAVLFAAVMILIYKIVLLQRGYDELTRDIEDQISGKTGVPVVLTTKDSHARKCAVTLNENIKELREEHIKYENGNRTIKEAVTNISHDLRTPLTAINSYLDLIEDETDEEVKKVYLERIKNRTDVLTGLTEELFKYSTITDRSDKEVKGGDHAEMTDLRRVIEECLISFYASFNQRGITPAVELPEKEVSVRCRKSDLDRIVENIISNALKYSDGDLIVTLTEDGKASFSNHTRDLTPVTAAKLFDRYYTVKDGQGSTGLGFSIARELTEKNGGSIEATVNGSIVSIILQFSMD